MDVLQVVWNEAYDFRELARARIASENHRGHLFDAEKAHSGNGIEDMAS